MLEKEIIEQEKIWAQQVVANAKSILLRNKKIATGALYNSVTYNVDAQGKIIFSYNQAGKWVTQGRRPGDRFPPPGPISAWIRAKGIAGVTANGTPISQQSLTFLISRAIARDGIKPVPFMKQAIALSIKQLGPKLAPVKARAVIARLRKSVKQTIE